MMGFFGSKKANDGKKVEVHTMAKAASAESHADAEQSPVKILGGGCAKCNQLEAATREALAQLGMDTAIAHIRDYSQIAAYGVMTTPALVVDGKVLSFGKVLSVDEVVRLLQQARG